MNSFSELYLSKFGFITDYCRGGRMSAEITKTKWRKIAACTMVSLWLVGCSSGENAPASIGSVGDNNSGTYQPAPVITENNNTNVASNTANTNGGKIVYNRNYDSIPKGSYSGDSYTVKRGDTLFYIAWISGNDFRDLANRNSIAAPYSLEVGQVVNIGTTSERANNTTGGMLASNKNTGTTVNPTQSTVTASTSNQNTVIPVDSQGSKAYSADSSKQNVDKMLPSSSATTSAAVGSWLWPTQGKVIDSFSSAEGGNKGVDIAGSKGQPVLATAKGRVVYAGNALRGYGNLIIVKHNDDYLSAYAHNDTMLVREQQDVKAGQKIATMGSTGTSSVRLHFEIRYKGKSVNPLRYLPQR